jgi:hypothetical protein
MTLVPDVIPGLSRDFHKLMWDLCAAPSEAARVHNAVMQRSLVAVAGKFVVYLHRDKYADHRELVPERTCHS